MFLTGSIFLAIRLALLLMNSGFLKLFSSPLLIAIRSSKMLIELFKTWIKKKISLMSVITKSSFLIFSNFKANIHKTFMQINFCCHKFHHNLYCNKLKTFKKSSKSKPAQNFENIKNNNS